MRGICDGKRVIEISALITTSFIAQQQSDWGEDYLGPSMYQDDLLKPSTPDRNRVKIFEYIILAESTLDML